jgi:CheY-like chemotaxis protein
MINKPAAKSDSTMLPETDTTAGGVVLLVDDEEFIRKLGEKILTKTGFEVITAKDGAECIDIYRKNHDKIDIVILDMNMPVMDGHQTMLQMKQEFPDIYVLISSGNPIEAELARYQEEGFSGVLQKPYRPQELSLKIKNAINGQRTKKH